ncbi:MAG: hypothetical protein ACK4FS_09485 [Flavobacterium sp.]
MDTNNSFKKLIQEEQEVPKSLKAKVMEDANNAKLLLDFAELFTVNIPQSVFQSIMESKNKPKTNQ